MTEPVIDLVLHEEHPVVGTSAVPVRRVKLVKRIVSEEVTVTVTVSREVVELVELDVPTEASPGGALLPGDREVASVVLHEQRPVVVLETVPVERVSLIVRTTGATEQVDGLRRREVVGEPALERGAR